ncbi:hypothetical protein [Lederbergia lenta]|uniref:hypothetical protein n=1 Tax=Lederbergia lenta TaxID=1467 RepID=UPI00203BD9D0|nr:hypothetical protein [Lederbergia lenta]MCM3110047.1 hypothetical protein [Lederbergia lenta]
MINKSNIVIFFFISIFAIIIGMVTNLIIITILGLCVLISLVIFANKASKKEKDDLLLKVRGIALKHDFPQDIITLSSDNKKALSISEEQSSVLLIELLPKSEDSLDIVRMVNFNDVIEVKVNKNSSTITRSSRGSQIGSAMIGSIVAGGIGAIIGGLSGSKTSKESIRKLSLEIVINDLKKPSFEVSFYDSEVELKVNGDEYNRITDEMNQWYRMFTVILHQNKISTS